ncbi:MAG: DUF2459 domain-containing protein [Bacteroidota bacterium]|nr:DUF2459 domain-containing protein [Rhodothermia bacterium]MCS7154472.1 DUF2459 domain-containing protein [Bacteroidota bacterium]MDW8136876.1 DUF2459 domain-containing protein [Bacteroidota bacterium]
MVQIAWHTGILVPVETFRRFAPDLEAWLPSGGRWLDWGWGDAAYYPAERPTLGMALRAVLWPTPSALRIEALADLSIERYDRWAKVQVSDSGLARLTRFLRSALVLDANGRPQLLLVPQGRVRFYSARGRYHGLRTCNTWAAEALAQAGIPICPVGIVWAEQLFWALEEAQGKRANLNRP